MLFMDNDFKILYHAEFCVFYKRPVDTFILFYYVLNIKYPQPACVLMSWGGDCPPIGPFQGRPNLPNTIIKLQVVQIPLPKHNSSVQILITKQNFKKPNTHTSPNMKQITHGNTHNNRRPDRNKNR